MLGLVWAVPPDILGMPTWILNGLSVTGLVAFILAGLATSRLWTRHQVQLLTQAHEREVENVKARYELHIERTIELYKGRVDDAVRREQEWHDVADRWQKVAEMLGDSVNPLLEQSQTTLAILQAWQAAANRPGRRS